MLQIMSLRAKFEVGICMDMQPNIGAIFMINLIDFF